MRRSNCALQLANGLSEDWHPDLALYETIIKVYCVYGNLHVAARLLATIEELGHEPTEAHANHLVRGVARFKGTQFVLVYPLLIDLSSATSRPRHAQTTSCAACRAAKTRVRLPVPWRIWLLVLQAGGGARKPRRARGRVFRKCA
jgi:pentatricopeptide repeat protein